MIEGEHRFQEYGGFAKTCRGVVGNKGIFHGDFIRIIFTYSLLTTNKKRGNLFQLGISRDFLDCHCSFL